MANFDNSDGSIALACYGLTPSEAVSIGKFAEEVGFDGLWLGEHALTPVGYGSEHPYFSTNEPIAVVGQNTPLADIWTTFGAIAASTSKLFLAMGVFILPLRHPLSTALSADTLQTISNGRFLFGVGTGWLEEEFIALNQDFKNRGARMDEIVDILQAAWAGGPFSFNGEHYQFNPVLIRTGSIHIPLIFGGTSKRALQRVVRGNGWHNPSSADLDECLDVKKNILSLLSDAGRSSDDFKFHIRIMEPTLKNVDAYRLAGFRDLSVSTQRIWTVPTEVPLQQKLDDIERISRELGL